MVLQKCNASFPVWLTRGLICDYLKKLCKLGMYANRTEKMARSLCRYKYFIHIFLEIMHLILSEV